MVGAHRLSCPEACEIFPDQGFALEGEFFTAEPLGKPLSDGLGAEESLGSLGTLRVGGAGSEVASGAGSRWGEGKCWGERRVLQDTEAR